LGYKTGGIFAEYEGPSAEVVAWQRSPAIGRFIPIRTPLSSTQVSSIKGGLDAAIAKFNKASAELIATKNAKCEFDEAWVKKIETKQSAMVAAEKEALVVLEGCLETRQLIEVCLMRLRQETSKLATVVGLGEQQWASGVLEIELDENQRGKVSLLLGR